MKIIPTGDRLLVKLNKVEERKIGHIIVADKHEEQSRIGDVLAVGKEPKIKPWFLSWFRKRTKKLYKVGDKVLVSFYSGIVIHLVEEGFLDDTLRIFAEREIMAKIED